MRHFLMAFTILLMIVLLCGCISEEESIVTTAPTTTVPPTTPAPTTTAFPTTPAPTWSAPVEKDVAEGDYTMFGRETLQVMDIDTGENKVVYSINEHGLHTLSVPFSTRMQDDFFIEFLAIYTGSDGKDYLTIRYSVYG